MPAPWGCADGLFEAYWRRPGAYLEDRVRRAMSVWTRVGPRAEQRAVRSLADDLASGRWAERNGHLADLDAADLGLRLLVACPPRSPAAGPYRGGSHRAGRATVPGRCSKVSMTSHSSGSGS